MKHSGGGQLVPHAHGIDAEGSEKSVVGDCRPAEMRLQRMNGGGDVQAVLYI